MTVDLTSGRVSSAALLTALDASLPLAESLDASAVGARFSEMLGAPIARCELLRVRYEPETRCVTTYAVGVGGRTARDTIGVVDLNPTGATVREYAADLALPGLRAATDPTSVVGVLPGSVTGCTVQPVGYHPGERAVLRYDVAAAASAERTFFGKVLARGAGPLAATLATLGDAAREDARMPSVPALVRIVDEHGLVVQRALAGEPLHAWVTDTARPQDQRVEAFDLVGRGLARLHAGHTPAPTTATFAGDVADVATYLRVARHVDAAVAARMGAAIDRARAVATDAGLDERGAVPSHGALRTDQVLLSRGRPGLLDLDGYCAAHPARDLGNFVAYLQWRALRQPDQRIAVAQARHAFLSGYGAVARGPADREVMLFEAVSLLKIAGRRFRSLAWAEWPLVPALVDTAASLVESAVQQ
jgi:hypothetical protein